MAFSYVGNFPNQQVSNSGVLSLDDLNNLESTGELGGSLELIQTQTVSGAVAQVDFTSIKESKYDVHLLTWNNILCENDSKRIVMRFIESGTIEDASVYQYANQVNYAGNIFSEVRNTGDNEIRLADNAGNDTGESTNGYVYCYNLGDSSKYSFSSYQSSGANNSSIGWAEFGGGVLPQTSTVDGIRFLIDGNHNITEGTLKLYGVKQI